MLGPTSRALIQSDRPDQRALVSVYDKTGLVELAAALARRRRRDRLDRLDRGPDRRRRRPGDPGRGAHRLPRVPRRPGEDAAPQVHAGLLADLRLELATCSSSPSSASSRSSSSSATSTRSSRPSPPAPSPDECVEQIDIGGPAMVRAAAKNHANVAVVISPDRYADVLGALAAGGITLAERAAARRRGVRRTPRPTTWRSRPGWARCSRRADDGDRRSRPGSARPGAARRAALRRELAPAAALYAGTGAARHRAGRAAGRQGDVVQQLRRRRRRLARRLRLRPSPAVAIIKHANPCGIAVGADVAEAHRQGPRLRPGLGVRRRDRRQPPGDASRWPSRSRRSSPRWSSPRLRGRRSSCCPRKKNLRLLRLPADDRPDAVEFRADLRRRADADGRPHRRRPATTRPPGRWPPATPRRRDDAGRPRVRLAGVPRGEVQRDPARARRRIGRRRHGPGQPGRLVPARRRARRRPGRRLGGRVRRVLPVRRRARRC